MRTNPLICRVLPLAFFVSLILCPATPTYAQAPQAPAPAPKKTPAPPKPAAPKAAEPAPAPAAAKAQDVQFKSKYTTGDQVTESVTYLHGDRERYQLSDMILLRQHDQNRVVQISRASNTYLVTPEGVSSTSAPVDPAAASRPPGVVMVVTSIVDTGERKTLFDQQARHVKTVVDR